MIYLLYEGEYEMRDVVAVYLYEGEAPLDLSYVGFLQSLGLRSEPPRPDWGQDRTTWEADHWAWRTEKRALEVKHALTGAPNPLQPRMAAYDLHRQWIESIPGVKKVDFERIE